MRVYIYACEDQYQGLHGMYEACVEELDTWDEVCEFGNEMAENVLDSYGEYRYDWEDWEDEDEYWETREESKIWYVYKIKDNVTLSIDQLNDEVARLGDNWFVEKYCDKEFDVHEYMEENE